MSEELADTRLGFRVPIPAGLTGAYLLCWKAGRDAAEKGAGWKVGGLTLAGKALRIYRLGWVSHQRKMTLTFKDRERQAIRARMRATFGQWRYAAGRKGCTAMLAQGDKTRAAIIEALRGGPMRLRDVALAVGLTDGTVHHQISALCHSGLVLRGRVGRSSRYELVQKEVAA